MPLLCDFPSPPVARESFAGGFTSKGVPLLTLEELEGYSTGKGTRVERLYRCPFCGASERAFHLNTRTGAFNCKRSSCGVKGVLREFWPQREPMHADARARRDTARAFAPSPQPKEQRPGGSDRSNWREQWNGAHSLDEGAAKPGRDFLASRGLNPSFAFTTGARFCSNWAPSPEGKSYRAGGAAILYPLRSLAGEVVAVGGRFLRAWEFTDEKTRSQKIKALTGGTLSEGAFFALAFDGQKWVSPLEWETPFVVEGPFDALALASCGAPALAAHGCHLSHWLAGALAFKAPFLSPDADEAGEKALPLWTREIAPFAPRLRVLRPEGFKDFGEMLEAVGRIEMRVWLREAGAQLLDRHADDMALDRLAPSIGATFPRAVAVEIGLCALALDRGEEIE